MVIYEATTANRPRPGRAPAFLAPPTSSAWLSAQSYMAVSRMGTGRRRHEVNGLSSRGVGRRITNLHFMTNVSTKQGKHRTEKSLQLQSRQQQKQQQNVDSTSTLLPMLRSSLPELPNVNPFFLVLWIAFLTYGIVLSPGQVNDPRDIQMIQAIIENPAGPSTDGNINPIFWIIFNGLGIMPIIIAQLTCPQDAANTSNRNNDVNGGISSDSIIGRSSSSLSDENSSTSSVRVPSFGLPGSSWPYLVASLAMGYGAAGAYLSFRPPPVESKTKEETSWLTRYVLESKWTTMGTVIALLSLLWLGGTAAIAASSSSTMGGEFMDQHVGSPIAWVDNGAFSDYVELFQQSKLVSVSSMDLMVLTLAAAGLIPRDLQLRRRSDQGTALDHREGSNSLGQKIAVATVFLPILGAALYCLWRPALPDKQMVDE